MSILWHGFCALLFASLAASIAMFGPMGALFSPIVMIYAAITALPLYVLASLLYRPGWITGALIGAFCTSWPLALSAGRQFVSHDPSYYLVGLYQLLLPGVIGGLVFHGIFAAATRPREI